METITCDNKAFTLDMRHIIYKVAACLLLCVAFAAGAYAANDGLYFHSHSYPAAKRTSLALNGGKPIGVDGQLRVEFSMDLRVGEPFFGNVVCVKTDDGKHIDAIFSMPKLNDNRPALVVDRKLHYINYKVTGGNGIKAALTLDKDNNRITYEYRGKKTTVNADLSKTTKATVTFGVHPNDDNMVDVAPINVRDISVSSGGKMKYHWDLRRHDGGTSLDELQGAPATATNGHWIMDDHVKWKTVLTYKSKDKVQVTFSQADNMFYIVDGKAVRRFDPITRKTTVTAVRGGHRAMEYSNYLAYDNARGSLYTYSTEHATVSHFDFATGTWSKAEPTKDEPMYFNHTWAVAGDTAAYAFGGYGYYRYHNNLFRINPATGDIRELAYSPKINPRTGAAAAVVGQYLYVFGGFGNVTGEQELPYTYYYDLTRIDLNTMRAEQLWQMDGEQQTSFLMASEMLYNPEDSTFYAATTNKGGRMIKIWTGEPKWKIVTDEMGRIGDYRDMAFDMYHSTKENKAYVVMNFRLNSLEHNIRIVSINLPLQDDYEEAAAAPAGGGGKSGTYIALVAALAAVMLAALAIRRKRVKAGNTVQKAEATAAEEGTKETEPKEKKIYYEPKGGSISILGKFVVRDKDGQDITASFTKRTRNLLLILLLYSEKSDKGIEIHTLDEALWQEMNENSARNNRNVYMRKLRMLLESVGDIEVVNDKIYYRLEAGQGVFFDYREARALIRRMEEGCDDEETTARTLELLFEGPVLPNYSFEWLDDFKADYSNAAISLLTRLLRHKMQQGDDDTALDIAKTIMAHDPFSDYALAVQCQILCRKHKRGIAKSVYDNFCKNYEASLGERYGVSFADACKA